MLTPLREAHPRGQPFAFGQYGQHLQATLTHTPSLHPGVAELPPVQGFGFFPRSFAGRDRVPIVVEPAVVLGLALRTFGRGGGGLELARGGGVEEAIALGVGADADAEGSIDAVGAVEGAVFCEERAAIDAKAAARRGTMRMRACVDQPTVPERSTNISFFASPASSSAYTSSSKLATR